MSDHDKPTSRIEWGVRWNDGELDDYGFEDEGEAWARDAIRVEPQFAGQLVCREHRIGLWSDPAVSS